MLFLSNSFGQSLFDGDIRWGEPVVLGKKERGPFPIGATEETFYATKIKKRDTYLQTYDLESLSLEGETELNKEYRGFNLQIEQSFVFGERVVFITSYNDKSENKIHYFIHELKNKQLGKPIELASVNSSKKKVILTRKALEEFQESGQFSFRTYVSDDAESLMISYQGENGNTHTVLFDMELSEVARNEMKLPYEEFSASASRLSNSGVLHMIGFELEKGESSGIIKREISIAGDCHMIKYDGVNGDIENFDVSIGNNIYSVALKILPDESTVVFGTYSNEKAKGVSGAFFQKINASNQVEFTTLEEFEEEFITRDWSERQKKKAEKKKESKNPKKAAEPSLFSFFMHDLAVKENGDFVLLAEQYYMYVTTTTHYGANGQTHTTTTYHYVYGDVVAVNCTAEGEVTWKQKVDKYQHTTNDHGYYSSFYTFVQGDNVFLMYNDRESNMDDAEEVTSKREQKQQRRNRVTALITFSEDGDMKRETLFDFEDEEARTLVPKRCRKMSPNEILLFTEGTKKSKILGWVTL